jgi:hypothetical protein
MATSAGSTLSGIYETYDAIAPENYAGKLDGKVVRAYITSHNGADRPRP